jgi:hypothetical protein
LPSSAPTAALNWDVGQLSMENKINAKKLMFLHYVSNLDNSVLAKEIFETQKKFNFPGFVPEARKLIKFYGLPNILDENLLLTKQKWSALVKAAIRIKNEEELKLKMDGYHKLKGSPILSETFEIKEYISKLSLVDARTNFRIRYSLLNNVKMNQKSNPEYARKLWLCDECGNVDSQSHIMWCPSYATLREGLDVDRDMDIIHYFQSVMKIRAALND